MLYISLESKSNFLFESVFICDIFKKNLIKINFSFLYGVWYSTDPSTFTLS